MNYLLLLANAPDAWDDTDARGPEGLDDGVIADWVEYTRALHSAGVLVGGHALHGIETATAVRVRNGSRLLVDGPFADTKEHLIGYYVIDVPDLDTALGWAARVPNARTGTIEVRPVLPAPTRRRSWRQGSSPGRRDAAPRRGPVLVGRAGARPGLAGRARGRGGGRRAPARRPRAGGGRRAGGLRRRGRRLGPHRCPGQARRLVDHGCVAQGSGRAEEGPLPRGCRSRSPGCVGAPCGRRPAAEGPG
jgi:hypothetical protein